MIQKIYGQVVEKKNLSLIFKIGFFEFEIFVSKFCLEAKNILEETFLFTYLNVKENEIKLFGFLDLDEREVFEDLISVEGIGPKAAMRMLSSIKYNDFRLAIEKEDVDLISKVKGVGKKIAGKIFLKLKNKLVKIYESIEVQSFKEIEESIVNMGFDRKMVNIKIKEVVLMEEFNSFKENEKEQFLFREVIKRIT